MVKSSDYSSIILDSLLFPKLFWHNVWMPNCMIGFTHKYLPLVSDCLRVLSALQDSLRSIYRSSVITHELKLYDRSYSEVFTTRQKSLIFSVFLASHKPNMRVTYLQNFLKHKVLHTLFCKLGCELYHRPPLNSILSYCCRYYYYNRNVKLWAWNDPQLL